MGYQEMIVKSKFLSPEKIGEVIEGKRDPMFLDPVKCIATVKQDLTCTSIRMFEQEKEIKPISLSKGDQFVVVTGERSAMNAIDKMFPITARPFIEMYPLDNIMKSTEVLEKNQEYDDIFEDIEINHAQKEKMQNQGTKKENGILSRLSTAKEKVINNDQNAVNHEKQYETER